MDSLEKVTFSTNGQWTLEKSKPLTPDELKLVEEFKRRFGSDGKKAGVVPPEPRKNPAEGMRPAAINNVLTPRPDPEIQRKKDEIAARLPEEARNRKVVNPFSVAVSEKKNPMATLDNQHRKDEEAGEAKMNHKKAWEATVAFQAAHGDKGMQRLLQEIQQKNRLNQAHETGKLDVPDDGKPKGPFQLSPEEVSQLQKPITRTYQPDADPRNPGRDVITTRVGKMHGEGATTQGKFMPKTNKFVYEDKNTGDLKTGKTTREHEVVHHWMWDKNKNDWQYVKSTPVEGHSLQVEKKPAPVLSPADKQAKAVAAAAAIDPRIQTAKAPEVVTKPTIVAPRATTPGAASQPTNGSKMPPTSPTVFVRRK
jgi:hypothetical protein